MLGVTEQAADVSVKPAEPTRNIRRRPRMSPRRAPAMSSTAKASVYPALSHWMVLAPPPSSRWMDGAATFTIVASSRSMTLAARTTAATTQRRRYRLALAVPAGGAAGIGRWAWGSS